MFGNKVLNFFVPGGQVKACYHHGDVRSLLASGEWVEEIKTLKTGHTTTVPLLPKELELGMTVHGEYPGFVVYYEDEVNVIPLLALEVTDPSPASSYKVYHWPDIWTSSLWKEDVIKGREDAEEMKWDNEPHAGRLCFDTVTHRFIAETRENSIWLSRRFKCRGGTPSWLSSAAVLLDEKTGKITVRVFDTAGAGTGSCETTWIRGLEAPD